MKAHLEKSTPVAMSGMWDDVRELTSPLHRLADVNGWYHGHWVSSKGDVGINKVYSTSVDDPDDCCIQHRWAGFFS